MEKFPHWLYRNGEALLCHAQEDMDAAVAEGWGVARDTVSKPAKPAKLSLKQAELPNGD